MLTASTPLHPTPRVHPSSLKLSSTLSPSSIDRSTAMPSPTPSLDSPPISNFAKRYRATPLPSPAVESAPLTPSSSSSKPSTPSSSLAAVTAALSHSEPDSDEEISNLVRRTSGKGYRVQENVNRRPRKVDRSGSTSSAEERRKTAAEKVEHSRVKVKAARVAEEGERVAKEVEEVATVARDIAEGRRKSLEEGVEDGSLTTSSYAKEMQRHMESLIEKMGGLGGAVALEKAQKV